MKHFLLRLFYFLLPIIILSYPIDYGISYLLSRTKHNSGEYEVMNDIYNSDANCDIAIYGSSRAWVHIDPKIISDSLSLKAYNFGIDGHNFDLQYLRHLEFLKYNKKPKFIILSLDLGSLKRRIDLYQLEQFLPYMLWNKNISKYTGSYIVYNKWDYYIPLVRYAGKTKVMQIVKKTFFEKNYPKRLRHNGFKGIDRKWNSDFDKAKAKLNNYEIISDTKLIDLFEYFIKECESLNINLIFVLSPQYIDGQNFISNRIQIVNIYKAFSKKYNLPFLNYSNDKICLNKNLFYNSLHLNKFGADIFSKQLAQDLKVHIQNKKNQLP